MRGRLTCRPLGRQPTASSGWRCGCSTPTSACGCAAYCRVHSSDVAAVGPRDDSELAAAGVPTLEGRLRALIRPRQLTAAGYEAALAGLPAPWWLHTDLDVLATAELAAVDYPQPGGLTWNQLTDITSAALATDGCAGWSVCIYNPDLDPGRGGADNIISYITQAITAADRRQR
jgi:arginase